MKLLLSIICIMLFGLFAYQVLSYSHDKSDSYAEQKASDPSGLTQSLDFELPKLTSLKKLDEYSEIIQRPLFAKNRTPAQITKKTKEDLSDSDLEDLVLIGIAKSTKVQIGIVANSKEKQIERLKVGHIYKDWAVTEIAKDYIKFKNDELEYKLFLTPIEQRNDNRSRTIGSKSNTSPFGSAYKGWTNTSKSRNYDSKKSNKTTGSIYKYKKKPQPEEKDSNTQSKILIKKPSENNIEDERSAEYYEGFGEDIDESEDVYDEELDIDDFYDDEEFTQEDVKELGTLGSKIYND